MGQSLSYYVETAVEKIDGGKMLFQITILPKLHGFVNSSGNNVILLFLRELNEVYGIAGYTNGELRIFFRMRLRIQKGFTIENVNVEVMTTVANVTV